MRCDDNPDVFKTRLDVYHGQTAPVTEYYQSRGLLDALQPIDVVTEELAAALAALRSHQIRSDVK